ncbi:hypothetical protein ACJX0J_037847, partial [Zea mays]
PFTGKNKGPQGFNGHGLHNIVVFLAPTLKDLWFYHNLKYRGMPFGIGKIMVFKYRLVAQQPSQLG